MIALVWNHLTYPCKGTLKRNTEEHLHERLFQRRYNPHPAMTDKVWITPKSNLVNQCGLLRLLTGVWVRGYLQKHKWLKDSCVTKAHLSMRDSSQRLGSWRNSLSLQVAWQAGEWPFLVAQLIFASSWHLAFSESLWSLPCLRVASEVFSVYSWRGRGLVNLVSCRNFLKLSTCWLPVSAFLEHEMFQHDWKQLNNSNL